MCSRKPLDFCSRFGRLTFNPFPISYNRFSASTSVVVRSAPTPSSDLTSPPSLPPVPELVVASDVSSSNVKAEESKESSSGGMSSGKKAGIAIGVIGVACVVGFGGMLYKKCQYIIFIIVIVIVIF